MKKKYVKVCPNCGSTNIGFEAEGVSPNLDFCKDCGLGKIGKIPSSPIGLFLEVNESELDNFRTELKKNQVSKKNAKRK